jgi:F0F1-type ATP synthase membrane subunit b/b'
MALSIYGLMVVAVLFLGLLMIFTPLLYRPFLDAYEERARLDGTDAGAEEGAGVDDLARQVSDKLADAKREARSAASAARADARAAAEAQLDTARGELQAAAESSFARLTEQVDTARAAMEPEVKRLSTDLASRALGRTLALAVLFFGARAAASSSADPINWFAIGHSDSAGHATLAIGWLIVNMILFLTLAVIVLRKPLTGKIAERAAHYEKLLQASEEARKAVELAKAELERRLAGLGSEIDAVSAEIDARLGKEKVAIAEHAKEEIARLQRGAEVAIERQRMAAERRLSLEAARLAMDAATEAVTAACGAADQERLTADLIGDLEGAA